ncbi:probable cytochrome P450 6a14 [Chironomus tepperi]|uniref:probable cytochrome P450 6a14 n=1 Tax=Chironomus tepperi TaxID=113505 RepID=UPI00391F09DD
MIFWILLALLVTLIYFADKHYHNYWTQHGVFQKDPTFILGAISETILLKQSFGEFITNNYKKFKNSQKVTGIYFSYRPALIINDPELVQDVMIRDFNSFHNRGIVFNHEVDPLAAHLFNLDGQKWRDLRVKLSPTFTSGKLRQMFPTIRSCVKILESYMIKNVKDGKNVLNMRDLMARYTTNVISSVAFGIDNDCINEPDNIFRKMGLKIFHISFKQALIQTLLFFAPNLVVKARIKLIPKDLEDFFMNIVKQTVDHREASKENERKDFMQLMIQLKNQGYLSADKDDEEQEKSSNGDVKKLTFNEIAAQAFLFFAAGFETSSSTMNFCLFELSRNPEKQKKVHQELDKILQDTDISDITYEMLSEMKYLECCIDEALRLYPIVPALIRESTKDHKFSSSNLKIESKIPIMIPVMGLQRDPEIYDNPMEFRPERFLDSTHGHGKVKGLFYMPFGDGPRNCIGARMGKLQTKLGLVAVLSKFKFELDDKKLLHTELEYDARQFVLTPKHEIMYKISSRV